MRIINKVSNNKLQLAVDDLVGGNLVVYPTDTIYGIAANVYDEKAIKKVFDVKNRCYDKAISICVNNIDEIKNVAIVNDNILEVLKLCLPGPYTFLLRKKNNISDLLTANSNVVGVRIPDSNLVSILTEKFPITSTSANLSNHPTPNNIEEIKKQLGNGISTYIDGGDLNNNISSTIIDLTNKNPSIVRKGLQDKKIINRLLKMNLY